MLINISEQFHNGTEFQKEHVLDVFKKTGQLPCCFKIQVVLDLRTVHIIMVQVKMALGKVTYNLNSYLPLSSYPCCHMIAIGSHL